MRNSIVATALLVLHNVAGLSADDGAVPDRKLADMTGLVIAKDDGGIAFGAEGDVTLQRSGAAALAIGAAVDIDGGTSISGELTVTGTVTADGGASITGAVTADGDVSVTGAVVAEGGLDVTGSTTIDGDVSVTGNIAINGDSHPFFPSRDEDVGTVLEIKVRSRGYDDDCPDDGFIDTSSACSSAISVNGEVTTMSRGHTIMYFDGVTGELGDTGYWDTHDDGDDSADVYQEIIDFVTAIPEGDIVVLGVHDSAANDQPASELADLLAFADEDNMDLAFRATVCLIGRRGSEDAAAYLPWQTVVSQDQYEGPADCSATIQTGTYSAEVSGSYEITASDLSWNGGTISRDIWVRVLSIGYDDVGYGCVSDGTSCTGPNLKSAIFVNGEAVIIDSVDNTAARGHNFVVLNQITGEVEQTERFDSHGDGDAGESIQNFVGNITEGRIVLVALHDAAGNYEHPESLLSLMAGHEFTADFDLRDSFCMIGRKGKVSVSWMTYYFNERYNGPSWCEANIPLIPPKMVEAYASYGSEGEHTFS